MTYGGKPTSFLSTFEKLSALLGTWRGSGSGRFPTIASFQYDEELTFRSNDIEPLIHFEQRTWLRSDDEKNGSPLHWESGFFKIKEDGKIEILNAQNSGRVEVLVGSILEGAQCAGDLHLSFESTLLGHDPRMIRTARTFFVEGDLLKYTVEMATVNTPQFQRHLEASLTKAKVPT